MNKHKLILPASILLCSLILGGFYYASQANKQRSIEKYQQIELQMEKDKQVGLSVCLDNATNNVKKLETNPVTKDFQYIPDLDSKIQAAKDNCYKQYK